MRKVLITGAAGYLAQFVIERLHPHYELTLTDIFSPFERREGNEWRAVSTLSIEGIPFIAADVTSYEDVEKACAGQDAVVHLVALVRKRFDKPPPLFADVMVKGTWNVVDACVKQNVKRLVNISSISAFGQPIDTEPPHRVGEPSQFASGDLSYALAKRLGEQICDVYHQAHGLSVIHLRPGVIAGDGHNTDPQAPEIPPKVPWFVYVHPRDIAQAVQCAIETESVTHGCYHIVAGRGDSRFDWTTAAEEIGYQPEYNWPEIPQIGVKQHGSNKQSQN